MAHFGNMISLVPKIILINFLLLLPNFVLAEGFVQLVGIPGLDPNNLSTAGYINALYILSISVAAFLAVVRIILAGVQYMLSDVVTDKGAAKKQIQGALLGLLIVLGAVLILETINPKLTDFTALEEICSPKDSSDPNNPKPGCVFNARGEVGIEFRAERDAACDQSKAGGVCGCNQTYTKNPSIPSGYECIDSSFGTLSKTKEEREVIAEEEQKRIEAGEFKSVVKRFNVSEFEGRSIDEKNEIIDIWYDECEGATLATETGNEIREMTVGSLTEYVCVKP